ncbi:DUF3221 domain-containing protein [Halobacillus litoralis]|uniref:DUF3221 domain-containing protein n=1 Tax=Halobacillus litoralis TaxID=45668 RepID=UPI00248FF786|nr:DUF3221 domain-containing protein [Halobacillus litoralis]
MKNWWMIGLLVSFSFLVASCGTQESSSQEYDPADEKEAPDPDMSGFVMEQEEDRILVVTSMNEETNQEGRAMWVSGVSSDSWVGKQVKIWIDGEILESFPEQAKAEKVQELEMSEVEGADLKASEALSTALSEIQSTEDILVVEMLAFDVDSDKWTVKLHRRGENDHKLKEIVDDKK